MPTAFGMDSRMVRPKRAFATAPRMVWTKAPTRREQRTGFEMDFAMEQRRRVRRMAL